ITPTVSASSKIDHPNPLGAYLDSLRRTAVLNPRLALTAHGSDISDPGQRVDEIVNHHHKRKGTIRSILADGPKTCQEITTALFSDGISLLEKMIAFNECYAHLIDMELEGSLGRIEEEHLVKFCLRDN
ncbi:MAG: hypothetical protein HQK60_12880, partial [Deltaproteobacteria bacterium]|nr:hypothetical protein [Deltaproteobacteria bacterium]